MKKYNYFYDGRPIQKEQFVKGVPETWENDIINGEYSWGYYRAVEIE
jgi:hypothetical protein